MLHYILMLLRLDFCQDEAALDTSYMPTIMQDSGASHLDETDQLSGTRFELDSR